MSNEITVTPRYTLDEARGYHRWLVNQPPSYARDFQLKGWDRAIAEAKEAECGDCTICKTLGQSGYLKWGWCKKGGRIIYANFQPRAEPAPYAKCKECGRFVEPCPHPENCVLPPLRTAPRAEPAEEESQDTQDLRKAMEFILDFAQCKCGNAGVMNHWGPKNPIAAICERLGIEVGK